MNYNKEKRKFRVSQINKSLRLLKLSRGIYALISALNSLDGIALKFIIILLGFQYDIYMKLREVSYDNTYLARVEMCKNQIEVTLLALGE